MSHQTTPHGIPRKFVVISHKGDPSRSSVCALCGEHEHQFSHEWDCPLGEIRSFGVTSVPAGAYALVDLCDMCVEMAEDDELLQFVELNRTDGRA